MKSAQTFEYLNFADFLNLHIGIFKNGHITN
jgi:hypothetical protein